MADSFTDWGSPNCKACAVWKNLAINSYFRTHSFWGERKESRALSLSDMLNAYSCTCWCVPESGVKAKEPRYENSSVQLERASYPSS